MQITITMPPAEMSPEGRARLLQVLADEYRDRAAKYGREVSDQAADQVAERRPGRVWAGAGGRASAPGRSCGTDGGNADQSQM